MDDIKSNCTRCGQHLAIAVDGAGATVVCPKCGHALIVPQRARLTKSEGPKGVKWWLAGAGFATIALLAGGFLSWQSHRHLALESGSKSVATAIEPVIKSGGEQQLVGQANSGQPQALLDLLDQNPALEKSLGLLAETPLRWALAQGPANARQMLSEAAAKIPATLREAQAPSGSVWYKGESVVQRVGDEGIDGIEQGPVPLRVQVGIRDDV